MYMFVFIFMFIFFSFLFSLLYIFVFYGCAVFNLTLPNPEESKLLFVPKAAGMIKITKH